MDKNKLQKLTDIGYRIAPNCGMCRYSTIEPGLDWGTCQRHGYRHLKHLKIGEDSLSIHRAGSCRDFIGSDAARDKALHFADFLEHRCTNFDSLQNQCKGVKRIQGNRAVCDVCGESFPWPPGSRHLARSQD